MDRQQFDTYKRAFNEGNDTVNLAYRHCMIGDDEQTRLVEEFEQRGDAYVAEFPEPIRPVMQRLLVELSKGDNVEGRIMYLLKPYVSNDDLLTDNADEWDTILFADTYDEYAMMQDE